MRATNFVAGRLTHLPRMNHQSLDKIHPSTDLRIRSMVVAFMQRGQFGLHFVEVTETRQIAGSFGAQTVGFERGASGGYASLEA